MGGRNGGVNNKEDLTAHDIVRTPIWLIDKMISYMEIEKFPNASIIDPCCGDDNRFLERAARVNHGEKLGIELRNVKVNSLKNTKFMVDTNFLSITNCSKKFDFALFNPPFSKCSPFEFLKHLFLHFMKPEGKICCIVPFYLLQQNVKRREWMKRHLFHGQLLHPNSFPEVTRVDCFIAEFRNELPKNHRGFYCIEPLDFKEIQV